MIRVSAHGAIEFGSIPHGGPIELHDWCNKGHPVCGKVYIKEPLLLIRKSNKDNGMKTPAVGRNVTFFIFNLKKRKKNSL